MCFQGTFTVLRRVISIENFPRLASRSVLHFKLQLPKERSMSFFLPVVRFTIKTFVSIALLRLPSAETAFNGNLSSFPFRSPCGFRSGNLLRFPCGFRGGEGCIKSGDKLIFQSKTTRSTFCSCELSLARDDFLRKLSGSCEPSDLRPFCYNIEKNTQHLLVVRTSSDCSLWSWTPTHLWRGSLDPFDLASNSVKNLRPLPPFLDDPLWLTWYIKCNTSDAHFATFFALFYQLYFNLSYQQLLITFET